MDLKIKCDQNEIYICTCILSHRKKMSPCAQHLFFSSCLLTTYITFCRGRRETPKRECGTSILEREWRVQLCPEDTAEIRAKENCLVVGYQRFSDVLIWGGFTQETWNLNHILLYVMVILLPTFIFPLTGSLIKQMSLYGRLSYIIEVKISVWRILFRLGLALFYCV